MADPTRPARKQVTEPVTAREEAHAPGTVNIWTGRVLREHRRPREERGPRVASAFRCLPSLDAGWTRGAASGATHCCLYFARGICHHGADCTHLHRLPTAEDEARHALDYSRDIFGRERAPASRDGRKKGVGSYERECKTLYVNYGGAGTLPPDQLRTILGKNFSEWGPLEHLHVVPLKTLAFVRYQWRSAAEFAKAAMHQQTLRGCDTKEVLDVRWANDDPNPRAVMRVQADREAALREAYTRAVNDLPPEAKRARIQQLHLQATTRPGAATASYPDTNGQYRGGGGGGGGTYSHTYEGWDQYLYQGGGGAAGGAAGGPGGGGGGEGEEEGEEEGGYEEGGYEEGEEQQDEAAAWAAWQKWQAAQPRGGGTSHLGGSCVPGGADDFSRYLRPVDWYSVQQEQLQQEQWAAWHAWQAAQGGEQQQQEQGGGAAEGQQQQQEQQPDADALANEALGLLGGYGSDDDGSSEGGEGGKDGGDSTAEGGGAAKPND